MTKKKQIKAAQIYMGPSIPGTLLQRYAVFRGELHGSIVRLADEVPAIKRLIVDVNVMADTERKLADRTSVQAQMFADIVNHIKGVMKR